MFKYLYNTTNVIGTTVIDIIYFFKTFYLIENHFLNIIVLHSGK